MIQLHSANAHTFEATGAIRQHASEISMILEVAIGGNSGRGEGVIDKIYDPIFCVGTIHQRSNNRLIIRPDHSIACSSDHD